jgi:hypothetical protein
LDIPVSLGREEASRRAAAELAKAKYAGTPGWFDALADRIFAFQRRLAELIDRLLSSQHQTGDQINWGFVIAVTVLLAALVFIIWKVGLPRWQRRSPAGGLGLDSTKSPSDYRRLAEGCAHQSDWPGAVRDRFRALVRELEVRTILDVRPARTAWEAAFLAASVMPVSREALLSGADLFSRVLYGQEPADESRYAQMVRIDDLVTTAADRVDFAALAEVSRP